MQYVMSKDFLKTTGNMEVLFYDSSKYNPPESFGNEYSSSVKSDILLKARASLNSETRLNVVAGVISGKRFVTHLKYGIDPDVVVKSLDALCSTEYTDADISPLAAAGATYAANAPYNIVLLSGNSMERMYSDGGDYGFTSSVSGTATPTFTYTVQFLGSNIRTTVVTKGSPVGVSPLSAGTTYVGNSIFDVKYAGLAFIGKIKPTYDNKGVQYVRPYASAKLYQLASDVSNEQLTLDCFVRYDPDSGRFRRYGASYFKIAQIVSPGQTPTIELLTRQTLANVPL